MRLVDRKIFMNLNHTESVEQHRIEYLLYQQDLYQSAKPELLGRYQGQYVAFEDGVVLDSDRDDRQLMPRIYTKYGHRDILIEYVCSPEPQLSVCAAGHLFPTE
jgi:Family of unknown function (DUF5678)